MLLTEFSSCRHPLKQFSCNTSYPFNNLENSIRQCFLTLDEGIIRSFDFCSVLEPSAWTHFEIISLIWPLDICGNETEFHLKSILSHQLQTIVCNSLLDKLNNNTNNYFRLQPIIHNFLLHSRDNSYKTFIKSSQTLLSKLKQRQNEKSNLDGVNGEINSDFYYFCFTHYLERNEQRLINLCNLFGTKEKRFLPFNLFKTKEIEITNNIKDNNTFSNSLTRLIQSFWK